MTKPPKTFYSRGYNCATSSKATLTGVTHKQADSRFLPLFSKSTFLSFCPIFGYEPPPSFWDSAFLYSVRIDFPQTAKESGASIWKREELLGLLGCHKS